MLAPSDMAGFVGVRKCSLCSKPGPAFSLNYALMERSDQPSDGVRAADGHVTASRVFLGELTELRLTLADGTTMLARGSDLPPSVSGERVTVTWPVAATKLLAL